MSGKSQTVWRRDKALDQKMDGNKGKTKIGSREKEQGRDKEEQDAESSLEPRSAQGCLHPRPSWSKHQCLLRPPVTITACLRLRLLISERSETLRAGVKAVRLILKPSLEPLIATCS
jgi:hypothetical protein